MIRVLEVLATLKRAGAETMAASLACGLNRESFDVRVVSLYDAFPGGLESRLVSCGIPVEHLGKRRGFDPRMYPRLARVLGDFRPDVIHTHSYVMRYTLPVAHCAAVHTVHNVALREVDTLGRMMHRIGYRRGVVPVAVATEVARTFEEVYGFAPELIPNGIETVRFTPRQHSDSREITIVSVARLEPQKNPLLIVEALPPGSRLLLVGDGSLRSQLEGRTRVELLGVREDVANVLAGAAVFALASDWEGHPIAVMEAMAAGLPVVATAVGGVPEIVGDAGILVPPGDANSLRSALADLSMNPSRRAELGRRAWARAQSFDVRRMTAAYAALFERIVLR